MWVKQGIQRQSEPLLECLQMEQGREALGNSSVDFKEHLLVSCEGRHSTGMRVCCEPPQGEHDACAFEVPGAMFAVLCVACQHVSDVRSDPM